MFPKAGRPFLSIVLSLPAMFVVVTKAPALMAQTGQTKPAFPLPSNLPVITQEQFISYWTAETGWSSELQLRNNSRTDLTVMPALRLPNGTETVLAPITVSSEEAKSVDLDQAISAANASQLVGSYGSVVLRYSAKTRASLYAAIMIRQPGYPVEFHVRASGRLCKMGAGKVSGGSRRPTRMAI